MQKWIIAIGCIAIGLTVASCLGNYARRIYRIGYEENPPLHFTGRDGRPSGLVVDVIEEAARRKRIRLNWVLQEGGSEAALRSNQVDLWPLIMITPERQKVIHISAPFAENIDFLIVRKESKYHRLSELENATLAYRGEEIDRRFLRTHAPMARLVVLKTAREILEAICQTRVDAGYLAEDLVRGALLDGISCSEHQLRMVGDTEMRGVLGIGSTFDAKSVADAIRDGISDMAFEGKLQSTTWNYSLSHDLEIAEALLRSRRREFWLALGIAAATALLFLSVWQALRIRKERNAARMAGQAQREAELKLRLLTDNLHEMVLAYDMDRKLIYVNPAVERLTGYSQSELSENGFQHRIHPTNSPVGSSRMSMRWDELFEGASFDEEEYQLLTKPGDLKWVAGSWGPILDGQGRQVGVQGDRAGNHETEAG